MRLRRVLTGASLALAALAALAIAESSSTPSRRPKDAVAARRGHRERTAARQAPLPKMVGQQVLVRMTGTAPDAGLLARIREGEVGGVILFAENVVSQSQVSGLVSALQAAARGGGNPPLLIATDQEGGEVKRLPWAPPELSPPEMGVLGAAASQSQGRRTGAALRAVGINVDLAPVVDVPHSSSAFIWQQQRSFGTNSRIVRDSTVAFATGIESAGVAPTAKHFPGLGAAQSDTDYALQRVAVSSDDLAPYSALIARRIPLIMVSNAVYTNIDPATPAALSGHVIAGLLRRGMRYPGVVITDDLERPTGHSTAGAVVRADRAGADIVLVSSTEGAGAVAYRAMLAAARAGEIPTSTISDAYGRILTLKRRYAVP